MAQLHGDTVNEKDSKDIVSKYPPGPNDTDSTKEEKSSCFPRRDIFRINKPLIPLKLSLFLWYGAGSVIQVYLMVFFKQRGLTIQQLSFINIITPAVQCFGPTVSGLIADKIGKSKPILIASIALVLVFTNSMLLIPYVRVLNSEYSHASVECNSNFSEGGSFRSKIVVGNCTMKCPVSSYLAKYSSVSLNGNYYYNVRYINNDSTTYNAQIMLSDQSTSLWCRINASYDCDLTCDEDGIPYKAEDNTTQVFIISMVISICFYTLFSNCYRFMDVTSMSMVKTYNSDFGRERLWCIFSTIILTPLAGYLVQQFTPEDGPTNYRVAFYMFDILLLLNMISVVKLDVQIKPPGEMMWKKIGHLLKNPDILVFMLCVLILGTSWSFLKFFTNLYLDDLGAPRMIFAIIPAVSSIAGIPFLLTSNWWVAKIGSNNLLVFGLLGYTAQGLAYSFLVDPWLALVCECFAIFTYHLLWVAVVRHSHDIAPDGLTATVIATAGGIHFGLGRGTGSLIGGLIMSKYGGRQAYRVIAIITTVSAVLFAGFTYFRQKYKVEKLRKTLGRIDVEQDAVNTSGNFNMVNISTLPPAKASAS